MSAELHWFGGRTVEECAAEDVLGCHSHRLIGFNRGEIAVIYINRTEKMRQKEHSKRVDRQSTSLGEKAARGTLS